MSGTNSEECGSLKEALQPLLWTSLRAWLISHASIFPKPLFTLVFREMGVSLAPV